MLTLAGKLKYQQVPLALLFEFIKDLFPFLIHNRLDKASKRQCSRAVRATPFLVNEKERESEFTRVGGLYRRETRSITLVMVMTFCAFCIIFLE